MLKFKKLISSFLLLILLAASCISVNADENSFSPGLDILSGNVSLIKTTVGSNNISFSPADFEKALGVSRINSITVHTLPLVTSGKLYLGNLEVMRGQSISRENISLLRFVPSGIGTEEAVFEFSADSSYSVTCSLYSLSQINLAPVISAASDSEVMTYRNISYFGTLKAEDPESDRLTYEVISLPEKGVVTVTDKAYGSYVYTPGNNFTGKDSFSYTVRDKFGNYAAEEKVTIEIKNPSAEAVYCDMMGHWAHTDAIKMTELGIMSGETLGGENIFSPDSAVSRCEFLVMALETANIAPSDDTDCSMFADAKDIPAKYRGYVAEAFSEGYINGISSNGKLCMYPNNQITRAEAAVILRNILEVDTPIIKTVFADSYSLPAWASDAVYAMSEIGVLNGMGEGYISPYTPITRAMTARMLSAAADYIGR